MEAASSANIIPFNPAGSFGTKLPILTKTAQSPKIGLQNVSNVLSFIWENSTEGMMLTDENGIIISINPSYCRLANLTFSELIGKHFTCIYAQAENLESLAFWYTEFYKDQRPEPHHEKRFLLWTNQSLDVEICRNFVESDDGRTLVLTQIRDITAEKITTNALRDSESKYRGLFANSVMPMFQSTPEGKLVNANRAMLKLLGYDTFYELADLDIAQDTYAYPEERKALLEMIQQKGYVVNTEIRLRRKNGRIITVLENARTLVDENGKIIGYEGILEDITIRKAMETKLQEYIGALEKSKNSLAELNAQKDKLFSILSHDLRSPFSSILGFCDILLKENDQLTAEDRLQFVAYIQEAAQDQLSLVNKLLEWSRIESGRIQTEQAEVDIQDVARKCMNSLMGLALQKQVKLNITLPAKTMVSGDKHMLSQVFGNLLGNSLKFTPQNGIVSVELLEENNNQWVIGVRDTGIGIPESDIHRLFKIEEKYTRKGLQGEKGTGLGLPVVYEIIQKHHGTISVKSSAGAGTLFIITLPKRNSQPGITVLVVDDEHGIRLLHSRYIKRILPDANVLHAADGAEAFRLAKEYIPRIIISDNEMPDFDGKKLLQNLKLDPATASIPVIIVTGQDSNTDRDALKQNGVTAILNKPITPEQFAEIFKEMNIGQITAAA